MTVKTANLTSGITALAIGAALAIACTIGGNISGGNYNPAITIMMVVAGRQPKNDAIPYILAQVAGGLVALEIYKLAHK